MLEIGLADDARITVRRAKRVRRRETVEADHVDATSRQLARRRAAHRAQADDGNVVQMLGTVQR
jgi:hypothetical protein